MRGLPGQPEMRVWDEAGQQLQIGNKCEKLKKSYGAIMTVYRGGRRELGDPLHPWATMKMQMSIV